MAKLVKNSIDEDLVRKLADLLEETGLTEIEYGLDGMNIRVAKQATMIAASGPAQAPSASTASSPPAAAASDSGPESDAANHPGAVTAPMVGVAYTCSEPGSPAFIQVGDEVKEGQTLFLIEAMKVFNPITAARGGRVTRILIENETPVEYGEPLAIIE